MYVGIWKWWDGPYVAVEEQPGVMPAGVQVSQYSSPPHVQGFATRRGKQTIMMSFGDIMNVILVHVVGGI